MGREIKRVPLDFSFPLDESYRDAGWERHRATCTKSDDECNDSDECFDDATADPPEGEGWQLWQTVSDGPITPVFATADELVDFMCQPSRDPRDRGQPYPVAPGAQGWRRGIAEPFVKLQGSAPSFVGVGGRIIDGPEAVVESARKRSS